QRDRGHLLLRHAGGGAGREPADHENWMRAARENGGVELGWDPDVHPGSAAALREPPSVCSSAQDLERPEVRVGGQNADDGPGDVIQTNDPTDDRWVAGIELRPEVGADEGGPGSADAVFGFAELATEQRLQADQIQELMARDQGGQ